MPRKNQSPYGGGFIKGKNTSEYNHNYYVKNKHRWNGGKHKSRRRKSIFQIIDEESGQFVNELGIALKPFDPIVKFIDKFRHIAIDKIILNLWGAIKRIDWAKEIDTEAIKESAGNARRSLNRGKGEFEKVINSLNRSFRQKGR